MKYIIGVLLFIAVISMNTVYAGQINENDKAPSPGPSPARGEGAKFNPLPQGDGKLVEQSRGQGDIQNSPPVVKGGGGGVVSNGHENNGSLWSEDKPQSFLFSDFRANSVGDILTVRIVESSKGNKNASTKTEKDSSISTSLSALFGIPTDKLSKGSVGAETSEKHDGSGTTSRSSQLTAVMTAKVLDVLPNGNLVIDGKREVVVNNETQIISINGIIRPEDIGPGNTILSSYIADAKITYTGSGVIGDKQRVGWLVRVIDFIWPF